MSVTQDQERLRLVLARLLRLSRLTQASVAEAAALQERIADALGVPDRLANLMGSPNMRPGDAFAEVIVSPATFTVTWRGRTCRLGNSQAFKILARLAKRPGAYISVERLTEEVWGSVVSDGTVPMAVHRLRERLRAEGMADLAARIRADDDHYYLLPNDEPDRPQM